MIKELNIFDAPLSGISLVEAGAGTGKTYNIASLYVRALVEKNLGPKNILVLTYTEAATAELKSRLRTRIKESITALEENQADDDFLLKLSQDYDNKAIGVLKEALINFEEAQISTIHGFCQRLLKEYSIEFGVSSKFEILPDESDLIQDEIDHFWRAFIEEKEDDFEQAVQKFIVDLGYHPDKLQLHVKNVLHNSYSTLIPDVPDTQHFKSIYADVKSAFYSLRAAFLEEETKLREVLERGVLNKTNYNRNAPIALKSILNWVHSDIVPLVPVYKLELFSSSIYEKVTKGNSIPDLAVTNRVDEYLELSEQFQLLEVFFLKKAINEIIEKVKAAKSNRDLLSYDDLLSTVEIGVSNRDSGLVKSLRKKYPIAFIDEFQDTDPVQYSIFKSLYSNSEDQETSLFMIGDPKQAIYSFRGADIFTYLAAKKDADPDQVHSLTHNYRSSGPMIDSVNKVFSYTEEPFVIDDLEFNKARFPVQKNSAEHILIRNQEPVKALQFIYTTSHSKKVTDARQSLNRSVAKEIAVLLNESYKIDEKKVVQGNIAVLVRTHKQASDVQDELRSIGIKSVIRSKESVYQSREALELLQVLHAVANTGVDDSIRSALATQLMGYNAVAIQDLLNDEMKWDTILSKFREAANTWKREGFLQAIGQLFIEFDVELNLAKFFDAERRITNLAHLIKLLDKAYYGKVSTPNAIFRYLSKKIKSVGSISDDELVRLESDEELVQIATMHASKGLEYDIVFCPYLWEDVDTKDSSVFSFHRDGDSYLDIGSEGSERFNNRLQSAKADFAERIRLAYVTLTRAKSACFVFIPEEIESELSPLYGLMKGSNEVFGKLEKKIQKTKKASASSSVLFNELKSFAEKNGIAFRKSTELEIEIDEVENKKPFTFQVKTFERDNLNDFPRVVSFSSLTSGKESHIYESEGFDLDETDYEETEAVTDDLTAFSFPRGARAGNLLHNIFENISFDDQESFKKIIETELNQSGFDSKWLPVIEDWVISSIQHPILNSGVSLSKLSNFQVLKELEFYFPVSGISANSINRILGKSELTHSDRYSIDGFMKGFIDLVFENEGRYYILDYKSNHLGNDSSQYDYDSMLLSIISSNYDVQYHIYTVALHRFLQLRKSDYFYENHFGGVIYLFLRGLDSKHISRGVFFDRPSLEKVKELDLLFKGGA